MFAVKSFTSEADARAFAEGKNVTGPPTSGKKGPDKFYGIAAGHITGVYTSWDEAQKQIENFKGPRYKRFPTREEAEEFVKNKGQTSATPSGPKATKDLKLPSSKSKQRNNPPGEDVDELDGPPIKKRQRLIDAAEPAESDHHDGFNLDSNTMRDNDVYISANGVDITGDRVESGDDMKIYTDGSSLGNGKFGAIAGVGVYFGPNSPLNVSEPLSGALQTNQRAELTAILRAISIAPVTQSVTIITDSQYSIHCVTRWFQNWEKNGWISSLKKEVQNKDLVQACLGKIRQRESQGARTNFVWVKGHSNEKGNVEADKLAVAGANQALRERGG